MGTVTRVPHDGPTDTGRYGSFDLFQHADFLPPRFSDGVWADKRDNLCERLPSYARRNCCWFTAN
jgi:hypothetical protein